MLDSYGMLAVCLDRRSAAEELGIVAGDQIADRRRSTDHTGGNGIRVTLGPTRRPAGSLRGMRPATTLTLALLLAAILVAGLISLARL